MPELPEVETVRRGLERFVVGRTIRRVSVRVSKVVAVGPDTLSPTRTTSPSTVRRFVRGLPGRRIVGVRRSAKMLLLELSGGYHLLVHLKMTGQLIVQRPGERIKSVPQFNGAGFPQVQLPHSHTMATFVLTGGTRMYYNDLRRFGYLRLVRNIDLPQVAAIAESGIEPLSRNFTFGAFADLLAKTPNQTIKEFLLDARRVAGIGNIYADEILFRARIRPTRRIRTLATHERRAVFQSVRPILTAAVRARGSSVGDFFDVTGTPGRYGLRHRVYGRAGKPCHRDGTTLKRVVVAGRGTVFCPACQS